MAAQLFSTPSTGSESTSIEGSTVDSGEMLSDTTSATSSTSTTNDPAVPVQDVSPTSHQLGSEVPHINGNVAKESSQAITNGSESKFEITHRKTSVTKADDKKDAAFETRMALARIHPALPEHEIPLDIRLEYAPNQLIGALRYTKLMEDRMQKLEREIHALKELKGLKASRKEDTDFDAGNLPTLIPKIQKLERADWFRRCRKETNSIEILKGEIEDEVVKQEIKDEILGLAAATDAKNKLGTSSPSNGGAESDVTTAQHPNTLQQSSEGKVLSSRDPISSKNPPPASSASKRRDKTRPSRIRIVSRLLRMELKAVTGYDIMLHSREILEPFMPLVLCEKAIREHQETLIQRLKDLREEEAQLIKKLTTVVDVVAAAVQKEHTENEVAEEKEPQDDLAKTSAAQKSKSSLSSPLKLPVFAKAEEDVIDWALDYGYLMVRFNISRSAVERCFEPAHVFNAAQKLLLEESEESEEDRIAFERRAKIYNTFVVIEEWKALIQLLDENLSEIIEIRNAAREGELDEACFLDLCYIFSPGDMVRAYGDNRQLLQIFSVSGGRRLLEYKPPTINGRTAESAKDALAALGLYMEDQYSPLVIDCFYYDFDGVHIGPVQKTFTIKRYRGTQKLRQLAVYPRKVNLPLSNFGKALVERGKKFMTLCSLNKTIAHKQYTGLTLDEPSEEVDSPIILDAVMASRIQPEEQPRGQGWVPTLGLQGPSAVNEREVREIFATSSRICPNENCTVCAGPPRLSHILNDHLKSQETTKVFLTDSLLLNEHAIKPEEMVDKDYALLPYRAFGFILRSRKWARLDLDHVENIQQGENSFDNLVLPKGYKDIVQALVETHFKKDVQNLAQERQHNVDLVKGKGKGLIILLHGAPGVGKTSTAECVAEYTNKPLFSITCGDIGDTAESVEKNLDRCFQMANKWGCVLLLDEADVFMARRTQTDLQRNVLVSVFLRVLEYYAGILFLTTNRVGTFDEAFKSRIHMSLGYPPLDKKSTLKIWEMNITRTKSFFEDKLVVKDDEILEYAKKHFKKTVEEKGDASAWNGRQIRNAFQTAIALAQWEAGPDEPAILDKKQFKKVAKASTEFDKYLIEVYGGSTDADRALTEQERADSHISTNFQGGHNGRKPSQRQSSRTSKKRKTTKVLKAPSKLPANFASASEEEPSGSEDSKSDTTSLSD